MSDIPWYGWVALGLLALLLISTNWSLINALRGNHGKPSENSTGNVLKRMSQTLQHPRKQEDEMLAELSRLTAELRKSAETPTDALNKK